MSKEAGVTGNGRTTPLTAIDWSRPLAFVLANGGGALSSAPASSSSYTVACVEVAPLFGKAALQARAGCEVGSAQWNVEHAMGDDAMPRCVDHPAGGGLKVRPHWDAS